jgi:hypothetical protein
MRCLFCKQPSDDAKSVEHIIPESIGNTKYVLPCGAVCDRCNNYFSHKVEGPLLSHVSFRNLRAWYRVPNKKGVAPRLYGFVAGTDIDVGLRVGPDGELDIKPERHRNQARLDERIRREHAGIEPAIYVFPRDVDPPRREMSRFMAKLALEALALRFSSAPEFLAMLVDEPHYDRIRHWARRGDSVGLWPYHQRRVFPEETLMRHPTSGKWVQAGYGHDLFLTARRETFFAFCLYGYEFVINVGGPSIRGYEEWLENHGGISPLVERVGVRLERRIRRDRERVYLVGSSSPKKGVEFDRSQHRLV